MKQLPQSCLLHMITHSRGGLVGDLLARFCNSNEKARGFNAHEINYLKISDRAIDIEILNEIQKEVANKKITIGKYIRVACPAGGTVLVSKRLDNFLNISSNLVGIGTGAAINSVYTAFRHLIVAAIDTKNDATILPGLEAMNPDSPFIKVLNSPATDIVIDHPLTIIAGNCRVKPNRKALMIIACKLFYRQDNDLVVNTNSMYQGAKRLSTAQYFFDESTGVDHFHYFKNKTTNNAILDALKSSDDKLVPGFSFLPQRTQAESERSIIPGGGQVFSNLVTGTKPILVLLPGFMGSNLTVNGKLLWINYAGFLAGELATLSLTTEGVIADSLIRTSYNKIVDYLTPDYDVITFPFDWRLQLVKSVFLFNEKILELLKFKQSIKIIGHSMGGVLVRDFILKHPQTWELLNQSSKFRLIFLGAPLGGSFRIPAILFGQDAIINKLTRIDISHSQNDLLKIFSRMPGILNLLPHTEQENDFSAINTWKDMRENEEWPIPLEDDLKVFGDYRNAIIKAADSIDYTNIVYIAGKDKATPCGYRVDINKAGKELVFLSTAEGDQMVTWESGIPKKMIAGDQVYYVDVTHGSLANEPKIFKGIAEILSVGSTGLLDKKRPSVRAVEKIFRSPKSQNFDLSPGGLEKTLLSIEPQDKPRQDKKMDIGVSISNGDLHYASYPVLAGHFLGDAILNAEAAIDLHMAGALSERNKLGIYPGEIGSSEIFNAMRKDFSGCVIVGLGEPGKLTAYQLTKTIEPALTRYLVDLNRKNTAGLLPFKTTAYTGISSLIIGSGYGSLSIESSLRAIIQGVQNANAKVIELYADTSVCIKHIEFIEQYEDTALNCFYSLNRIRNDQDRSLTITMESKRIKTLLGSKKQLQSEVSAYWWKRLTVTRNKKNEDAADIRCLQFSLSTGGAREEQKELYSSTPILEQLLEDLSTNNHWTPQLARTIFELMVPNDFKEQIRAQSNLSWILEEDTASYPWELLHDASSGTRPFCVNAGMIRQLLIHDYRQKINAVTRETAFIVGDPNLEGFVNQLPGANDEAKAVHSMLLDKGYTAVLSLKEKAPEIIGKLFQDDYKIIHLAGHGIFNILSPEKSGMLIGNDLYLSTREISQMSSVPELVFVNCCFLGKTDGQAEALFQSRYKLAANIGTQLIKIGVKVVIVAGWAVDDAAALEFTRIFYNSMFEGDCFGDAVKKARKRIYEEFPKTNTWGAYQCYGDPFYKFRDIAQATKPRKYDFVIPEQAAIELHNLGNRLDTSKDPSQKFIDSLRAISEAINRAEIISAEIIEKEAFIYAELREYDLAISKFETLLKMEQAGFSIATIERYCNVRAKKYIADYLNDGTNQKLILLQMNKVIQDLKGLLNLSPTSERFSLLASAYKRKAMLSLIKPQKINALIEAAFYYNKADAIPEAIYKAYAKTNWLEIECILVLSDQHTWEQTVNTGKNEYKLPSADMAIDQLKNLESLLNTSPDAMDYWNMMAKANIKLCMALLIDSGAKYEMKWQDISETYHDTWVKAGSRGKKIGEIEHLELLLDGLSLSNKPTVDTLRKNIERLKEELQKMI
ncbi:MAG: CHAT domain-containing protein [Ferruginibacter sp.]|nr:CHAT domain-containing protein [Chitinophagaceae bacterium]